MWQYGIDFINYCCKILEFIKSFPVVVVGLVTSLCGLTTPGIISFITQLQSQPSPSPVPRASCRSVCLYIKIYIKITRFLFKTNNRPGPVWTNFSALLVFFCPEAKLSQKFSFVISNPWLIMFRFLGQTQLFRNQYHKDLLAINERFCWDKVERFWKAPGLMFE